MPAHAAYAPRMLISRQQLIHLDQDAQDDVVHTLAQRAEEGDAAAQQVLRDIVIHYGDVSQATYVRTLNRAYAFKEETLTEPLLAALSDTDYGCQAWSAMACGQLGVHAATPLLVPLLGDADHHVRESVCTALGELRAREATGALAALLLDDPLEHVRAAAARALSAIGTDDAVEALFAAFHARRYPVVGYLVGALARCGPRTHHRLVEATAHDDAGIRYWAARTLGATGDDQFEPLLSRVVADDHATTPTGARVSTGAKKGLRTMHRIQAQALDQVPVPEDD